MNAINSNSVFNVKPEDRITLEQLLETIREKRGDFTKAQQVTPEVIEKIRRAGIFRALVAKQFGGDEMTPGEFIRLIERIAEVDGSAAWVASFGHASAYIAALPIPTLEIIYKDGPDVSVCGALFPPHVAKAVDGGLEVKGRWKFGSGTTGADLVGVGIKAEGMNDGGLARMALMTRDKVGIAANWDVNGLRGTGSHDVVVDKVVVPVDWTFIRGSTGTLDSPLFRYPVMALAAQVLAVVGLGVARGALDTLKEMAGGPGSITGAPTLANRAYVQTEVAQAEAALRSARAFFYEATEDAYATLVAGETLSIDKINLLRLSSTHAAKVGVDVAQTAYRLAGTTAIYTDHPIARHFNDALVVAQHAFLSTGTWTSAGQIIVGLEAGPGFP